MPRLSPKTFPRVVAGLAVAALAPRCALAGAFNQDEGRGQIIFSQMYSGAGEGYDVTGKLTSASRFQKLETSALVEYGVTDRLTAILKPSFVNWRTSGPPDASYTGPGMTEAGAQIRLAKHGSTVFAAQAMLRVPGAPDSSNLALVGATRVEQEIRGLAGHGFEIGDWSAFIDLQVGYRWRHGGPPSEWRGDFTLGARPAKDWMLLLQSFNTISASSSSTIFPKTSSSKLQASVVHDVTKTVSLQLGGFGAVAGRNALRERGLIAALWLRF